MPDELGNPTDTEERVKKEWRAEEYNKWLGDHDEVVSDGIVNKYGLWMLFLAVLSIIVAVIFLRFIGVIDPSINSLDAATAAVFSFAIVLNLIVIFDHFVMAGWRVIEDESCDISTDIDEEGNIVAGTFHDRTPIMGRFVRGNPVGERSGLYGAAGVNLLPRPFVRRYVAWRTLWWFGAYDLYRTSLSRYIPLFLIAGTGVARFILGEAIIPFVHMDAPEALPP